MDLPELYDIAWEPH